ncbi:MAG TPA: HAD family hydrolase [Vicinamibacterales bacterium]|nr:HAD family hydrolase [Vicinamibacterales bacterium]
MYLILFDIDGTLVLTGRAGMRAMNRAVQDLVRSENPMDGVQFAGRTDWSILEDILRKHGKTMDAELLVELRQRYVMHLTEEIQLPGTGVKDVMPGVRKLLDALDRRNDTSLALLTGNFIEGARIKLEYFDLWKYFSCGAFGGDAANRNDLVPIARRRARDCGLPDVEPGKVLVVGDTPNDIECALVAGVTPIAVATGGYSVDDLRASGAQIVFEDLSDTSAFLDLLDN